MPSSFFQRAKSKIGSIYHYLIKSYLLQFILLFKFNKSNYLRGIDYFLPKRMYRIALDSHLKSILLVPIGRVPLKKILFAHSTIESVYGVSCKVSDLREVPSILYNPARGALNAELLLRVYSKSIPKSISRIVIITDVGLYTEEYEILHGYALLKGKVAAVSLEGIYRSDEHKTLIDEIAINERFYKLILHELGHTFNLPHCTYYEKCLMRETMEYESIDSVAFIYCNVCHSKIIIRVNKCKNV